MPSAALNRVGVGHVSFTANSLKGGASKRLRQSLYHQPSRQLNVRNEISIVPIAIKAAKIIGVGLGSTFAGGAVFGKLSQQFTKNATPTWDAASDRGFAYVLFTLLSIPGGIGTALATGLIEAGIEPAPACLIGAATTLGIYAVTDSPLGILREMRNRSSK